MFYGTINETCVHTDYLEMELENSLLFFKSLDILEESGIQIVQESAWETIKTKIKELWEKFKNWVKSIWERVKAIFTKKKSTIEKIRETNKKIKSSKGKVNESFNYIKEESEDSEGSKLEEIKWYGRRKEGGSNFNDYILSLYGFGSKCLNIDTLKDDESFNKFSNNVEEYKTKLDDYGTNLFFDQRTYKFKDDDYIKTEMKISTMIRLVDEISKDSEDLNDDFDAANILLKESEEKISKIEKEMVNIIKYNTDSEGNFITINGEEVPVSRFNQVYALSINSLKTAISFLTKAITIINEKMGYNLRVMIQLSHGKYHTKLGIEYK